LRKELLGLEVTKLLSAHYSNSMYRLLQIDELQRSFHYFLTAEDDCFYFMEYTSNTDFRYSPANDLISNFKKSPEYRDQPQWLHKGRAIWKVGNIFAQALLPAKINCLNNSLRVLSKGCLSREGLLGRLMFESIETVINIQLNIIIVRLKSG
jgi:hypothetical protein